ncbi:hypothetical protein [Hymenobacter cellulosivorans]|uniref:Uncharacterized protein n=1 Tax=Hymenobacter cellulosivorans TaxID=2932249 RepID=A0ABY4F9B0_9BACT|nr:hypothetical protein [Hymenobacter cellulosivorans]UOQ52786.1 hypothetical protein MUN80_23965 [Hymenobacter cellulosivorans]
MLLSTLLVAGVQLLYQPAPATWPAGDTTRVVRGFLNQNYAWGTLVLRDGSRLQAYLPATTTGGEVLVPYYVEAPKPGPK